MKKRSLSMLSMLFCTTFLAITSCKKDLPIFATPTFNVEIFKQGLENQLSTARGYQIVISQSGQVKATAANGIGDINAAGGTVPAHIDGFVNIASVTKPLTAATVIRLLDELKITIDSEIGQYLPPFWDLHPDFKALTYRQLLTHTSGIQRGNTTWTALKEEAAKAPNADKSFFYANVNFGIFRAMIPRMADKEKFDEFHSKMSPSEFERWMSEEYIWQVNKYVIYPSINDMRYCTNNLPSYFKGFNEAPFDIVTYDPGEWTDECGGGGFYMSTKDMSAIITTLAHTEVILNKIQRDMMDGNQLGWNRNFNVRGGIARGHGGGLYRDTDGSSSLTPGEPGLQTMIVKFPNNVQLALAINSVSGTWRNTNQIVQTAFNAAWVVQ